MKCIESNKLFAKIGVMALQRACTETTYAIWASWPSIKSFTNLIIFFVTGRR